MKLLTGSINFDLKYIRYILLFPLGLIYGWIAICRRWLYDHIFQRYQPSIPTICMGNIAVGGTGKTPHIEYLIQLLSTQYTIATLSRGYKRKSVGFLSTKQKEVMLSATTLGDEPWQLHTKYPNIQVAVCEKRSIGIQQIMKLQPTTEVILLDDAFQHIQVKCGLYILLTEFSAPLYSDFPLPAGNLREFKSAMKYAHIIIVTKCPNNLTIEQRNHFLQKLNIGAHQHCFFTSIRYKTYQPLSIKAQQFTFNKTSPILVVTGIAHPKPLIQQLNKQFSNITTLLFADHHTFTPSELTKINHWLTSHPNGAIMTTDKDAARFSCFPNTINKWPIFSIPIDIHFLYDEEYIFQEQILKYLTNN